MFWLEARIYEGWADSIRSRNCAAEIGGLAVVGLWHRCHTLGLEYLENLDRLTNGDMSSLMCQSSNTCPIFRWITNAKKAAA
jgi:hypothetical protein